MQKCTSLFCGRICGAESKTFALFMGFPGGSGIGPAFPKGPVPSSRSLGATV